MKHLSARLEHLSTARLRLAVHAIGCGVTASILAVGYFLFFASSENQEVVWQASIDADTQLVAKRDVIASAREMAECELFAMSQRLDQLTAMIPHTPDESRFLAELAELAGQTGLVIRNFRPGPAEDAGSPGSEATANTNTQGDDSALQRIRVNLSGAGSYDGICRFLDGLQALPRLTHVSRLDVVPQVGSELYPVELELSIFFAAKKTRVAQK